MRIVLLAIIVLFIIGVVIAGTAPHTLRAAIHDIAVGWDWADSSVKNTFSKKATRST